MKNKQRERAAFTEHSFWQSYSDMMAALLLIFILIIAITLAIYRQKTTDLERTEQDLNVAQENLEQARINLENYRLEIEKSNKDLAASLQKLKEESNKAAMTQEELDAAYAEIDSAREELAATKSELQDIVGIRTDIIGELQAKFNNSSMKVDPQTGSITFSSDVLFEYNSSTLTDSSKNTLKGIIPMYLGVLLQDSYRNYVAEIIIEGHTDTIGSYQSNMVLSYERASAVAQFCMDPENGLSGDKIAQLQKLMTVNGRSFSNPIYLNPSLDVDMEASRRVEIKFRLKEDEMIQKISNILAEQSDQPPGQRP
ncbi:OmpA family protein [Clostridium sp. AN503]|uniref:OmpA family protein n=1 Tax=Clostridium sp. AN503 TaxID=3160598 RepID=UPI003457E11D